METTRVEAWLDGLLKGDSTLNTAVGGRIYGYLAPQDAAVPYVIYSYQRGHDVFGVGTARIMAHTAYQVKVVGQTKSFVALETIANRLDIVLQGASGSVVDGEILACVREQPISYVETDSGVQYRHLGGLYRIIVQ